MSTENQKSSTKTLSGQGGVMMRFSLIFILPMAVLCVISSIFVQPIAWLIFGDDDTIIKWFHKYFENQKNKIKN